MNSHPLTEKDRTDLRMELIRAGVVTRRLTNEAMLCAYENQFGRAFQFTQEPEREEMAFVRPDPTPEPAAEPIADWELSVESEPVTETPTAPDMTDFEAMLTRIVTKAIDDAMPEIKNELAMRLVRAALGDK